MADLSPAAQAVVDAFTENNSLHDRKHNYYNLEALAAALRAVADQVLCRPEVPRSEYNLLMRLLDRDVRAIADELEGCND